MKITNKITKDNNEALYIFSWNSGEIIEVHTENTFKEKYNKESNSELWKKSYLEHDNKSTCIMEDVFDDNMANEELRSYDNMLVIRL